MLCFTPVLLHILFVLRNTHCLWHERREFWLALSAVRLCTRPAFHQYIPIQPPSVLSRPLKIDCGCFELESGAVATCQSYCIRQVMFFWNQVAVVPNAVFSAPLTTRVSRVSIARKNGFRRNFRLFYHNCFLSQFFRAAL